MAENVNITYETLFEFLRLEKTKPELQKLDGNFFVNVVEYLKQKQNILDESENKSDIFSVNDRQKTVVQIQQIKKILKDLYERREKKIVDMAMIKSRTASNIIDTSSLLDEEKALFDNLLKIFDSSRSSILINLITNKLPVNPALTTVKCENNNDDQKEPEKSIINKTVRFKYAVPQFMGKNLEVYGPFEEGDIANLPEQIAEILITKERAEYV